MWLGNMYLVSRVSGRSDGGSLTGVDRDESPWFKVHHHLAQVSDEGPSCGYAAVRCVRKRLSLEVDLVKACFEALERGLESHSQALTGPV